MRLLKRSVQFIIGLILTGGVAVAAIPGPQRAFAPSLFGLTEIAPNIFTDAPDQAADWLSIYERANDRDRQFFGELLATPRYILCTTMTCERTFGKRGNVAQTYGWSYIHIPPLALQNPKIGEILMAHERVHAELVYRWGASALWDKKIPTWFNEGLATLISLDFRVESFYADVPAYSSAQRQAVKSARYFWDWGTVVGTLGWHDAYGAAAENVKILQARIGDEGLRALIARSLNGEDFDEVMIKLASKN